MANMSTRRDGSEIQKKNLYDHQFRTNTARLLRSVPVEDQVAGLRDQLNNPIS